MFELVKDQLAAFNRPYEDAARRMPALVTGIDGNGGDIATVGADLEIASRWTVAGPLSTRRRTSNVSPGIPRKKKLVNLPTGPPPHRSDEVRTGGTVRMTALYRRRPITPARR